MNLIINGEAREFPAPLNVDSLLEQLGFDARRVAFERNLEIVPRSAYAQTRLDDGDRVEIVHFIGGGDDSKPNLESMDADPLVVAGRRFASRLIVGTGKYKD